MNSLRMFGAWLMAGSIAACTAVQDLRSGKLAVGDEYMVATAGSGETCRVRKLADDESRLRIETFDVRCDGWDVPAASLRRFAFGEDAPLQALLERDDLVPWQSAKLNCGETLEAEIEPGLLVYLRNCTTREGWPMQAWAARTAMAGTSGAVVGFGYPHVAPIVETVIKGDQSSVRRGGTRSPLLLLAEQNGDGSLPELSDIMDFHVLLALAQRYNQAGQFSQAVEAIEQALIRQKSIQGGDTAHLATIYAELGLNLASDGRREAAETSFEEARKRAEKIEWSDAYTLYLSYLAVHRRLQGDLEQAARLSAEVVNRRLARFGPNSLALAHARGIEASLELEKGNFDIARNLARTALSAHRRASDYAGMSFALGRLAKIEREAGHAKRAAEALEESLYLTGILYGDGPNKAFLLAERAKLAESRGDVEGALADYATMLESLELSPGAERAAPKGDLEHYLDLLIEAAHGRQDYLARVFEVSQWMGDPVVDKAVRQMTARLAANDPEIAAAVRSLEGAKVALREARFSLAQGRLQGGAISPGEVARRQELLAGEADRVSQLERELMARFPAFGRLRTPSRYDAASAREYLAADEGLLRLVVGERASYAILLLPDGRLRVHKGPMDRELTAQAVTHLRNSLTFAHGLQRFDVNASHALHSALFGDLDKEFDRLDKVTVIASGPLLSLPMGLLARRPYAGGGYHTTAWLGADVAISMTSSVASFVHGRRDLTPSQAQKAFFGLGDPVLNGGGRVEDAVRAAVADCEAGGGFDPAVLKALPSLPETRDELALVASALGAEQPLIKAGAEASETDLRQLPLRDYRVLSFATHGLLPHELPCNAKPALVLTPPDHTVPDEDGLLDVSEIASLDLDADWVVLSACNTAGPDGTLGGEALTGLASAFLHAGSRSLLASHWDVASDATVKLMRKTFEAYGKSGSKTKALQQAQLSMMRDPDLAHPAFWAAFTLIGDPGSSDLQLARR